MLYYFLKLITALTYAAETCGPDPLDPKKYILCTKIPGAPAVVGGPVEYLSAIYQYSLVVVGLIGFGLLVWSGLNYILQRSNYAKLADIKDHITQILFGIILLVFASVLLNEIDPKILTSLEGGEFTLEDINKVSLDSKYNKAMADKQKILDEIFAEVEEAKGDQKKLEDFYYKQTLRHLENRQTTNSLDDPIFNEYLRHLTPAERIKIFTAIDYTKTRDFIEDYYKNGIPITMHFLKILREPKYHDALIAAFEDMGSVDAAAQIKLDYIQDLAVAGGLNTLNKEIIEKMYKTLPPIGRAEGFKARTDFKKSVKLAMDYAKERKEAVFITDKEFNIIFGIGNTIR